MKGRSIVEAVLVFAVLQLLLLFPEGVRNLIRWESGALGGSYLTGALMIVLPVVVIIMHRYEFSEMGVTGERWRRSVNYGLRGWLFFIIPQYILYFFLSLGVSYKDNIEFAGFIGVLVLCAGYLMINRKELDTVSNRKLVFMGLLLVAPLVLALIFGELSAGIIKGFAWNILIGGFAEEFLYRGFIQSSVNLEYGTGWKIGKINVGPGLLISSLLYGLGRGLRTIKPWRGVYSVSWSWTLFAFTVGLFYGFIRESSGDIIGSGTAHSLIDAIGEVLVKL